MRPTIHKLQTGFLDFRFRSLLVGAILTGLCFGSFTDVIGQTKKRKKPQPQKAEPKLIAPEVVVLETKDKVQMKATYFAAGSPTADEKQEGNGKSVVPIILVHDWDGDRAQVLNFGRYLQNAGFAVIAPDLRGHGESVQVTGQPKELNYKRFRKSEIASVRWDIERCKKYLVKRHNEGNVNVDMLTVVAVGKSCALAVQWTIGDWFDFPAISAKGIKQGQDVKALVLVSPRKKLQTMLMPELMKHPLFTGKGGEEAMPIMMIWGQGKAAKDGEYLSERLKKARPDLSDIKDPKEKIAKQTFFPVPLNDSLTGVEILEKPRVKGLWLYVTQFITTKVVQKAESFPWKTRDPKKKKDDQ